MHTNKPKVICRRQIAVACAVFAFAPLVGGCAGMMKQLAEELTDEKVEFKPVYTIIAWVARDAK